MQSEISEVSAIKRELKISYSGDEVEKAWKRSTKSVQDRVETLISQIGSGSLKLTEISDASADASQDYLQELRAQRDDLDKAIALARNPQRKVY